MVAVKVSYGYVVLVLALLCLLFYATAKMAEEPSEERFTVWLTLLAMLYITLLLPFIKALILGLD